MAKLFYVYVLLDPTQSNQPFYVGKGCDDRWRDHLVERPARGMNRSKFTRIRRILAGGLIPGVRMAAKDLEEADAYRVEAALIRWWGRAGFEPTGILLNLVSDNRPPKWDGKTHTSEAKTKIGAAHRGKTISEKQRRHNGDFHRGKAKPEGHGTKVSRKLKGRPHSPEHTEKIAAAHRGKKVSEEVKARISAKLKGVKKGKPSPEHYAKLLVSMAKARAAQKEEAALPAVICRSSRRRA